MSGLSDVERRIERAILDLLAERSTGKTICPSEAARRVQPSDWRPLMDEVRRVAARMTAAGQIEVTQRGDVVDLATAKGPVRLRSKGVANRR